MNEELLFKYIYGKASQAEKEKVAEWIDADSDNLKQFLELRKTYDIMIWQDEELLQKKSAKIISFRRVVKRVIQIAAMFVVTVGLGFIISQYSFEEEVKMQTIYVPAGQHMQVALVDGTKVWINGNSTFSFPGKFSKGIRGVKLDGEAYFEVQKDKERQFIVTTPHQSGIRVLGTKFNVKAYQNNENVTTTLVEGRVNFEFYNDMHHKQSIAMKPGQKAVYNSSTNKVNIYTTSGEKELSWKEGKLIFDHSSLKDVLAMLSEKYDVEFIVDKNVSKGDSFSGTFVNMSLEQILNYIKASSKVRWQYLNNQHIDKEKTKIKIY